MLHTQRGEQPAGKELVCSADTRYSLKDSVVMLFQGEKGSIPPASYIQNRNRKEIE